MTYKGSEKRKVTDCMDKRPIIVLSPAQYKIKVLREGFGNGVRVIMNRPIRFGKNTLIKLYLSSFHFKLHIKHLTIKQNIQHLLGMHKKCKSVNRYPGWCDFCLREILSSSKK